MATKHVLLFEVTIYSPTDCRGAMTITGDPKLIGQMLAQFAVEELKAGRREPTQMLVAMFEESNRLQGIPKSGIIKPVN